MAITKNLGMLLLAVYLIVPFYNILPYGIDKHFRSRS